MNKDGEIVSNEDESYGCKVGIDIHRPDMAIVLDEVGCNLSQENDNAKGGLMFMCAPDEQPYQSIATKSNHFTCLGLTLLSGEAIMCIVIIQGKKRDILTESGIDWDCIKEVDVMDSCDSIDESEFFLNNYGNGNLFPGGPVCNYKGVEVPLLIAFSEGGGINGQILTDIFRHLDELKVYDNDRANGFVPFVLLDGFRFFGVCQ